MKTLASMGLPLILGELQKNLWAVWHGNRVEFWPKGEDEQGEALLEWAGFPQLRADGRVYSGPWDISQEEFFDGVAGRIWALDFGGGLASKFVAKARARAMAKGYAGEAGIEKVAYTWLRLVVARWLRTHLGFPPARIERAGGEDVCYSIGKE